MRVVLKNVYVRGQTLSEYKSTPRKLLEMTAVLLADKYCRELYLVWWLTWERISGKNSLSNTWRDLNGNSESLGKRKLRSRFPGLERPKSTWRMVGEEAAVRRVTFTETASGGPRHTTGRPHDYNAVTPWPH